MRAEKRVLSLALMLCCTLGLSACTGDSKEDETPPGTSSSAEEPGAVPAKEGTPGAPIRQGFKVAEGTRMVDEPTDQEDETVKGWYAVLLLEDGVSVQEVVESYRSQLRELGYTVAGDVAQEVPEGSQSLRGERNGTLPGAAGSVPVEVAQVSVVPASKEVPGHVQLVVTAFKAANQPTQ